MRHIAADFGASSGRIIAGYYNPDKNKIELDEIYRFPNRQIKLGNTLYWDFLYLFEELKTGLKKALYKYDDIVSIGADTWGVDFGLIDKSGHLISNPVCYRDSRTSGILEKSFSIIPKEKFYKQTGNQFMEINTVFQLYSLVLNNDPILKIADKLLFMPDLINYFLTGIALNEYTISTTSQFYNPHTKNWAFEIFEELNLPIHLMQKIIPSGTIIGDIKQNIIEDSCNKNLKVIAVGSHDTASALASIETTEKNWAFISSGTWSLMGIEVKDPIITPKAFEYNFTNEGTVNGKIRFLKNITGLWILQNIIKEWEAEGETCDYNTLVMEAEFSNLKSIIDVDHPGFNNPNSMRKAIINYCENSNQSPPSTKAEFMRCITLSLAKKYAEVKQQLEICSGHKIDHIYVVGGGSRNKLLNKLTEEFTKCKVITGEIEATAIGNIKTQIKTLNKIV